MATQPGTLKVRYKFVVGNEINAHNGNELRNYTHARGKKATTMEIYVLVNKRNVTVFREVSIPSCIRLVCYAHTITILKLRCLMTKK